MKRNFVTDPVAPMVSGGLVTVGLLLPLLFSSPSPAETTAPAAAVATAAIPTAPTRLHMDGDAGFWSGLAPRETLFDRSGTAGTLKLAYDDANLYANFHVDDATPLKNGATVIEELIKGGDALGLCFGRPDGPGHEQRIIIAQVDGRPVILAMRPHWTDKTRAHTFFTQAGGSVPMDFVADIQSEGAAAHLDALPGGYEAEIKLPWTSLGIKPAADLRIPFDAQIIFSDPSGTANVETAWWHTAGGAAFATTDLATEARLYPDQWGTLQLFDHDPGPRHDSAPGEIDPAFVPKGVPIAFTLPRACRVSAIVKDNNGWVVRELLRAEKMDAGAHTIYWDGRDRWGAIEPPGAYTYRIGYFDGIKTTFAGSVGNSAYPPYRTVDGLGSIGGMHAGPQALAAATDGPYMYLLNGGEEGQPSLRKMEIATGKSLWFHSVGTFGMGEAMAADANYAYMVIAAGKGGTLIRMDPKTGANVNIGPKPLVQLTDAAAGLAIVNDRAYFTAPASNRVGVIDLATGNALDNITVTAPAGICADGANGLLVSTGQQVERIDAATGALTPFASGFQSAGGIAEDAAGNVYVADLSGSQQIKRFSKTGQLLGTIGAAGGRGMQSVPYNPLAFSNVTGLAVGPDGDLWGVEQFRAPRRFFRLTTDGKWVQDVYGPARCGDTVGFDQDDFSTVYYLSFPNGNGQFVQCHVDYAAYAAAPDGTKGFTTEAVWHMNQNGADVPAKPDIMLDNGGPTSAPYSRVTIFTATNGKKYFFIPGGNRCGLWLWEKGAWRPVAAVGATKGMPGFWSDKNGDGLVDPDETSDLPAPTGCEAIGADLSLYYGSGTLSPASVDARGVPTYAGGSFKPYLKSQYPSIGNYFDEQAYYFHMSPGTSDDSLYFSGNNGPHQNKDFWDRTTENRIVKIHAGRVEWMVGHHDGSLAHDGDEVVDFGVAGETDGMVVVSDVDGNFVGYTTDGLALGWLLTNPDGSEAVVGPNGIYVENAAPGVFLKDPKTGRHLLLTHTSEDVRILNVTGGFSGDVTHIDGSLQLTAPVPRPAQVTGKVARIPYLTWTKSIYETWRGTNVDAYDYEWSPEATALPINDGKAQIGEIRLRRDAGNLCLFADVLAPGDFDLADVPAQAPPAPATATPSAPLVPPDASTLFGHADGVELLLGPGTSPNRTTAAAGDTRIFLTATRGADGQLHGWAYACRPASPPTPSSKELSQLDASGNPRDGGTKQDLDLSGGLVPIPGALVKVRDRFDGKGYALEAEVPIALMPELAQPASISYWHAMGDTGALTRATRSDLTTARLNAAVWLANGASARRVAWQPDKYTGTDPKSMNPSTWALASDPLPVTLAANAAGTAPVGVAYESTRTTDFSFSSGPTVRPEGMIFGGGFFDERGVRLETTAPVQGFSMEAGPGSELPYGTSRSARLDLSDAGINSSAPSGLCSNGPGQPVTVTVKVAFPPGQSGELHVLWGAFTANSGGGGDLMVSDDTAMTEIDKSKAPDLSMKVGYNANFETRETIFRVDGERSLTISLTDNSGTGRSQIHGVWITPNLGARYALGQSVALAAFVGGSSAPLHHVQFLANGIPIASAAAAPFAATWRPVKPGTYVITAQATDTLGATGSSPPVSLHVAGPK